MDVDSQTMAAVIKRLRRAQGQIGGVSWSMTAPSPKLSSSGWAITTSALGQAGNIAPARPARGSAGPGTFMTHP